MAGKNRKDRSEDLLEIMGTELKLLRSTLREISAALLMRRESEIETLVGYLATMHPQKVDEIGGEWLKQLRGTTLKPAKGRLKDLKKIDLLLEKLLDLIIDHQHPTVALPPREKKTRPGGKSARTEYSEP